MLNVNLGAHFDSFVQEQVERGHFSDASEVVRAGLRLLEDRQDSLLADRAALRRAIDAAFDDPRPSVPAEEVFAQLRLHHEERVKADRDGR